MYKQFVFLIFLPDRPGSRIPNVVQNQLGEMSGDKHFRVVWCGVAYLVFECVELDSKRSGGFKQPALL
jgi:hypothetical protein